MTSQEMFKNIYKNKKVFVTGHTGFQGSWLALWLKILGSKVIGYSLKPPTNPALFNILKLENEITHIIGDVRDEKLLQKSMKKHKPHIVFHLAAQPLVRASYEKPSETFHVNVQGTANVLEAIRNTSSVKAGVIITSDKCYENKEWNFAYRENDPLGGHDPYSASKGAAEIITSSYNKSFFDLKNKTKIGIATIRAGNVIGGGDWADDRIIPDSMRSLFLKKPIKVRNPNSIRPWQHVLEPISGMLLLAQKLFEKPGSYNEAWNFGPNISSSIKVKQLVNKIIKQWKNPAKWEDLSKKSKNSVHEANYLRLDSTKVTTRVGWEPVYSIDQVVNETVEWYWNYLQKKDMIDFTKKQIEKYVEHAKNKQISWSY
jgi:CDP-glucose 4,6-dehydratase